MKEPTPSNCLGSLVVMVDIVSSTTTIHDYYEVSHILWISSSPLVYSFISKYTARDLTG